MPYVSFSDDKCMTLLTEHDLQKQIVIYLRDTDILFASNCNGFLDSSAKRLKAWHEGMSAGHPDLLIYTPNDSYNGFAIEFKTPKGDGKLDNKQSDWLQKLEVECKYFTLCSNDYTIIIETIIKYIHNIL